MNIVGLLRWFWLAIFLFVLGSIGLAIIEDPGLLSGTSEHRHRARVALFLAFGGTLVSALYIFRFRGRANDDSAARGVSAEDDDPAGQLPRFRNRREVIRTSFRNRPVLMTMFYGGLLLSPFGLAFLSAPDPYWPSALIGLGLVLGALYVALGQLAG